MVKHPHCCIVLASHPAGSAAGEQGAPPASLEADAASGFRQLGLSEWLDRVCAGLGMTTPTQVQRGTIPAVLAGRNVIGVAHTGSGKTAAFALPILQQLARDPYGVFALVLTPTRWVRNGGCPCASVRDEPWVPSRSGAPLHVGGSAAEGCCLRPLFAAQHQHHHLRCAGPPRPPAASWPSSWPTSFGRWAPACH